VERAGDEPVAVDVRVQVLEHERAPGHAERRGALEGRLRLDHRGAVARALLADDLVDRLGGAEAQRVALLGGAVVPARGRRVAARVGGAGGGEVPCGARVARRGGRAHERRLVALVARHRAHEHRHAGRPVAREQRREVGAELLEPAPVERGPERHLLVAGHELHHRAGRVGAVGPRRGVGA
jgi:hypothetical protein